MAEQHVVPQNLIFISGMHGCGKDTLIEDFLEDFPKHNLGFNVLRYKKCEMTGFKVNFERQPRRIAKYVIDFFRAIKMAVENPTSMVITDRCCHDAFCYIQAFGNLGWFTNEELLWIHHMLHVAFEPWSLRAIAPFFLNPPFEFIQKNLVKRQAEKGPKWHETDQEYCKAVFMAYQFHMGIKGTYINNGMLPGDYVEYKPGYECLSTDRMDRVKGLLWFIRYKYSLIRKEDYDGALFKFHPSLRDDGSDGTPPM